LACSQLAEYELHIGFVDRAVAIGIESRRCRLDAGAPRMRTELVQCVDHQQGVGGSDQKIAVNVGRRPFDGCRTGEVEFPGKRQPPFQRLQSHSAKRRHDIPHPGAQPLLRAAPGDAFSELHESGDHRVDPFQALFVPLPVIRVQARISTGDGPARKRASLMKSRDTMRRVFVDDSAGPDCAESGRCDDKTRRCRRGLRQSMQCRCTAIKQRAGVAGRRVGEQAV